MINILGLHVSTWLLLLLLGDIAVFCSAVYLSLIVMAGGHVQPWYFLYQYKISLLLMALTYVLVLYIANLYDHYLDFRRRENIGRVILTCLMGTLVVLILFFFLHIGSSL